MSDELQNGVPGVPEGTGPGQPQPTAEEQLAPAAPLDLSKINLDDLPQYRAVKSNYDRQVAQAKRDAEDARRAAVLASQQAQTVLKQVESFDPNAAKGITEQLAASAVAAERDFYRQNWEMSQWERDTEAWGMANGLDVRSDEFRQALTSRDTNALSAMQAQREAAQRDETLKAEAKRMAEEMVKQMGGTVPATSTPAAPAKTRPVLPPMGGSSTTTDSEQDQLWDEYEAKAKAARSKGRMDEVRALSDEYRKKGLKRL